MVMDRIDLYKSQLTARNEGMGLGKRVRITRPPGRHEEWTDQLATVLTLIPVAKNPLTYKIRLDSDGSEHVIKGTCLEPAAFEEERTTGSFQRLIVNDCMYCLPHGLEVCGECGVDHRWTNLPNEIADDQYDGSIQQLIDELNRLGVPGRKAPSKRSKSSYKCPANTAIFNPNVNEKLILPGISDVFDPRAETWPAKSPTEMALLIHSNFPFKSIPEEMKLPLGRVRDSIVVTSRMWHQFLMGKSSKEPMVRIMLQDPAQTHVLVLDLVLPIRRLRLPTGMVLPVFVVRWAHVLAANMENAAAVLGTMERGTKMGEIPAEVDEIEFFAALLKENSKQLDPIFVRSIEKHSNLLSVSFFTSISEKMQGEFYDSLGLYCARCGTSGVDTMKCARCVTVSYCSRQCQKEHWKYHKHNGCKSGK